MSSRSSVVWVVLLVIALAVPGILFYQWYTQQSQAKIDELSVKVRSNLPGGSPFADTTNPDKLLDPNASPSGPLTVSSASLAGGSADAMISPVTTHFMDRPSRSSATIDAGAASSAPSYQKSSGAQDSSAQADVDMAVSTETPVNEFLSWRDPTLSPGDLSELARLKAEEEQRQRDEERQRWLESRPKPKPDIRKSIHLEGIVSALDGTTRVIVNGEAYSQGDMVGRTGVKILRIKTQDVDFIHRGKIFV